MPLVKYTGVSRTAALALTEFSDAFRGALVLEDPDLWSARLGLVFQTNALKTIFPIPLDAAGYKEFKGDQKYRSLYTMVLSMLSKKWSDGVEEDADVVESDKFLGWLDAPANMAREWLRLPNVLAALMLEANPVLDLYRDPDTNTPGTRTLFAADHPFNVLLGSGSFNNDLTTTVADIRSGKFFEDASDAYAKVLGPNGKALGLTMTGGTVLTSLKRDRLLAKALGLETVVNAITNAGGSNGTANVVAAVSENNLWKGVVTHEVAKELTSASDDYVFTFAAGKPGAHAFIVQQESSPEEIIMDESSDKYKEKGKISIANRGEANAAAALPHTIIRWHITG